ncbi:bacteriocin immunity protein [Vagococcus fluvialis]|uniref:bacteriocin immunity protein n=1 Tax=Vagococcus fluvialis TaxID=2738 RepID=UPI003797C190
MKKKSNDQEEFVQCIKLLLEQKISIKEKEVLEQSIKELEKSTYLPGVINGLRTHLTPLAIKGNLSEGVSELYKDINSSKYMNKNLGGMISVWSNIFH